MKFGNLDLATCNHCPAYQWAGESISRGNCGYRCGFGAFSNSYAEPKQIPPSCPIRVQRNLINSLKGCE